MATNTQKQIKQIIEQISEGVEMDRILMSCFKLMGIDQGENENYETGIKVRDIVVRWKVPQHNLVDEGAVNELQALL